MGKWAIDWTRRRWTDSISPPVCLDMATQSKRIGDVLVAKTSISRAAAEAAAVETVLADTRITSVLVTQGKLDEVEALRALSEQFGVPAVDLRRVSISAEVLTQVPQSIALSQVLLPLAVDGQTLLVAMATPTDRRLLDELTFATGMQVLPHVALHFRLRQACKDAYANPKIGYKGSDPDPSGAVPLLTQANPPAQFPSGDEDEPLELTSVVFDTDSLLSLPAATAASASAAPTYTAATTSARSATSTAQGLRILVVDDEPDIAQLVVDALKPLGHEVFTASRGGEALQLVKSIKPNLIVLDAMLPEVHGFEICRKVKESKRFAKTPVLMISAIYRGWRIAEDIKALYKVDAFLEKPFRIAELRRQAEILLANSPQRDDNPSGEKAQSAYVGAVTALKASDYDGAFGHLHQAEALDPFSANIQLLLGRVLEHQERAFQAIYHYERAVELDSMLFPAIKNLAVLYHAKGFKNKAIEMWERALRAAPSPQVRETIKTHLVSIL